MSIKTSIRFFNDKEVRAVWDDKKNEWLIAVVDIISAIVKSPNPTTYWRVFKKRLKDNQNETVTKCNALKLKAQDGKMRLIDCLPQSEIINFVKVVPSKQAQKFLDWFVYSDNTIDGQSKKKAYDLFESGLLNSLDAGTIKCLQQIHAYLFGGLYDFAGQIRTKNISKDDFTFAPYQHFSITLSTIENMPETDLDAIIEKYIEMNIAHPFMEGNGRSSRIWLDLMLKRTLKKCVDWSKINKNEYLNAMRESVSGNRHIKTLIKEALTNKINDREMFMKGIDYSYYYEEK